MRNELELIEQIERYLMKQMNATERTAFEEQLRKNPELQQEVDMQHQLMQGIKHLALKDVAKNAQSKWKFNQNIWKFGLGGTLIATLAVSAVLITQNLTDGVIASANPVEKSVKQVHLGEDYVDVNPSLPSTYFSINAEKDTLLVSNKGVFVVIPEGAFLDENGKPVTDNVVVEWKEALDAQNILTAGLGTTSNGELLETGGMFYLQAWQNGKALSIDPNNPIVTDIPGTPAPGMMLFDGEIQADGNVNWVNPKPLERFLTPADIMTLNFYPPAYLPKVRELGKDAGNRSYTDSLYYSFAGEIGGNNSKKPTWNYTEYFDKDKEEWVTVNGGDAMPVDQEFISNCIDPAKIQAIRNPKFNGTLLATKEFEDRIPAIHGSCNGALLDLYVNNLDKPMWYIDSLAWCVASNKDEFRAFYEQKQGKTKQSKPGLEKLQQIYEKQQEAHTKAAQKAEAKYWDAYNKAEQASRNRKTEQSAEELNRLRKVFLEELEMNLDEACKQLGYTRVSGPGTIAVITSPGMKNIDQYVFESTLNRTTLDYTDPLTGKKAVIKYEAMSLTLSNEGDMDKVFVYLLPNKLSSFNRISKKENVWRENLNELLKYDLLAIGYKNGQAHVYHQKGINPQNYTGSLDKVSDSKLKSMMAEYNRGTLNSEIAADRKHWLLDLTDQKRHTDNKTREDYKAAIRQAICPCYTNTEWYIKANIDSLITIKRISI